MSWREIFREAKHLPMMTKLAIAATIFIWVMFGFKTIESVFNGQWDVGFVNGFSLVLASIGFLIVIGASHAAIQRWDTVYLRWVWTAALIIIGLAVAFPVFWYWVR